ncbi:MAG: GTP-binding protein LepA, GTP-binding protein LepA [Candidatus Parcubacteria bacterium]|jgi:GTP-binding protein LepA
MDLRHIRNFSIIAHIDHGKSTLADRMLEVTKTIEARKMRDQVLDSMDLEKERGITIKMTPVSMDYSVGDGEKYKLNLIDTPGHIDFSYEVSRAIRAVEGSILLVDSTQGVQAQTLSVLQMARDAGLVIIPVLSKVDSPLSRADEVRLEVATLLDCDPDTVMLVSGKTGEGVPELLAEIVQRIPPPKVEHTGEGDLRALVFDFQYSNHAGVIVFVRILDGQVKRHDHLMFATSKEKFQALEVGFFHPDKVESAKVSAGEIGYIVTGIKQPGIASVGDTVTLSKSPLPPYPGYMQPKPVVWASIYPESQDDFNQLKLALGRLRLSDSAFSFEEESSGALGRGYRCGFLGMLHLEIISERLRREFNLELIVTMPSITYKVKMKSGGSGQGKDVIVYSPHLFPNDGEIASVEEPWVAITLITPMQYLGNIMQLLYEHEAEIGDTVNFGEGRSQIHLMMPLRELMRNFFDELKSSTSGYASISYEIGDFRPADVVRLDLLVADEPVAAFTRIVSRRRALEEAENAVEKLHNILPRQQFETKIQGFALGRILSSKTVKAFRKDVLMHGSKVVGGGDVSRKKKLLEKQKKGKARQKERFTGKVNIPHEVFLKMMRSGKDD